MKRYWIRWLAPTGLDCTEQMVATYEAMLRRVVFLEEHGASNFLVLDDHGGGIVIG